MIEAEVEADLVRIARDRGWASRKIRWIGRRGAPDRAFFRDGRIVFLEVKRPGNTVRGAQRREFLRLKALYPDTHVVDSIDQGLRILDAAAGR